LATAITNGPPTNGPFSGGATPRVWFWTVSNLLKTGSEWLADKRKAFAASTVTYSHGGFSVEVEATIGTTRFDVETEGVGVQTLQSRDFLIFAADLVLEGVEVPPARGAQIRETVGSKTFVFEVMAPGQEPPWRYSDSFRKTLRIHTKHVDTE